MPEYVWHLEGAGRIEKLEVMSRTATQLRVRNPADTSRSILYHVDSVYTSELDAVQAALGIERNDGDRLRRAITRAEARIAALETRARELGAPAYLRRSDGRLERLCEHGLGHTVAIDRVKYLQPYEEAPEKARQAWWSHGCDGCCAGMERLHA